MKTSFIALLPLLLVQAAVAQLGSITPPPDSPAPQRRTLSELQPRTPLIVGQPGVGESFDQILINAPGVYYLTSDVTQVIEIRAHDVTLDLNGYSVSGWERLIYASITWRGAHIRNGYVFDGGIMLLGAGAVVSDCLVENAPGTGIDAPLGRVERCVVDGSGEGANNLPLPGAGIRATIVEDCIAQNTWLAGIMVTVTEFVNSPHGVLYHHQGADGAVRRCYGRCTGVDNGMSGEVSGIFADKAAVEDSVGISGLGSVGGVWNAPTAGIRGATVLNCKGRSEGGVGISGSTVQNSSGTSGNSDSGVGIGATSASECMGISTAVTAGVAGQRSYGISASHVMNSVASGTTTGIYCVGISSYCQATRPGGGIAIQGITVTGCTTLQGGTVGTVNEGYYDGSNLTIPPLQKFLGTL